MFFLVNGSQIVFAHRQFPPGKGTWILYRKQEMGCGSCIGVGDGNLDHTGGSRKKDAEEGCGASIVTLSYC